MYSSVPTVGAIKPSKAEETIDLNPKFGHERLLAFHLAGSYSCAEIEMLAKQIVSENSVFFIELIKHNGSVKLLAKNNNSTFNFDWTEFWFAWIMWYNVNV